MRRPRVFMQPHAHKPVHTHAQGRTTRNSCSNRSVRNCRRKRPLPAGIPPVYACMYIYRSIDLSISLSIPLSLACVTCKPAR